jgi:hypothetical protein
MMRNERGGVPPSPYIVLEAGLQVGLGSTSRVHLGVLYTIHGMYSFLSEYFTTVVLARHAITYRVAQVG